MCHIPHAERLTSKSQAASLTMYFVVSIFIEFTECYVLLQCIGHRRLMTEKHNKSNRTGVLLPSDISESRFPIKETVK